MKTALLLDVHNLYAGINKKFPGKVLNYVELLNTLKTAEYDLFSKVAYGRQQEDKAKSFSVMLRRNGFDIVFGNVPHNIQMTIKAADIINNSNIDTLILGTNYYEVAHIFKYARDKGINTMCLGVNVPEFFNQFCHIWEIDDTLLIERKKNEVVNEEAQVQ